MVNLLPQEHRRARRRERHVRLTIVGVLGIGLATVIGIVSLVPTYLYSQFHLRGIEARQRVLEEDVNLTGDMSTLAVLDRLGEQLAVLSEETDQGSVWDHLVDMSQIRTDQVHIREVVYRDASDEMRISGVADTRDALIAFTEDLELSPSFRDVVLPVDTLIRDTDVSFLIRITIDHDKEE